MITAKEAMFLSVRNQKIDRYDSYPMLDLSIESVYGLIMQRIDLIQSGKKEFKRIILHGRILSDLQRQVREFGFSVSEWVSDNNTFNTCISWERH